MPLPPDFQPISKKDKESIESYFESDPIADEELDFPAVHGLLSACAVGPQAVDKSLVQSSLLGSEAQNHNQTETIINLLLRLAWSIEQSLNSGDIPELPCPLTLLPKPDESQLRSWCVGFMEGLFLDEKAWFINDQEIVAELTLPIMAVSGLFEDENDFKDLNSNSDLLEHLCSQVSETLLDLYLFFHAPALSAESETKEHQ